MDQLMTIAEIESRFRDEWVLVQSPETNDQLEVVKGRVRCHSRNRDEIDQAMLEQQPPRRFAILFTRSTPDNKVYVL
jgi:hypothetical protein